MIDKTFLKSLCENDNIELNDAQLEKLSLYSDILVEWNEKINLTAIKDSEGIALKHFYDSLIITKFFEIKNGARMIDVGTGAGFPSVPIKVLREDISLTLLDSLNKRISFLQELCQQLGLSDVQYVHARAEDGGNDKALREQFDIATARAVAALRELSEYCLPFVKVGGYFVALKGGDSENEIEEAKPAIKALGGKVHNVYEYTLNGNDKRTLIVIKKVEPTLKKYPRIPAKIKKQPIK